ncbi:amino acid/amide ABC transporter substrate-binding protein, HAAT family [Thermomonospora echinospora]|uniref:Amino acid/amide ABC transporter substrate-binding protein, HAAT family n=1 Tax=Thermomonospora echinospora TaxID=1992 RepID=A0A1H5U158_9ACTN|nr:ABC transporter substrate-binding protein [Thermomonospora echinospora]SEF68776.1 amino acid/amide ABC transporter substrate-binding protein, HAAT family [Thermomonospora echinospora]
MRRSTIRWASALAAGALVLAGCASKEERAGDKAAGGSGWNAGSGAVKIGLISPMTGPYAILGILQQNSIQVEMDRINQAGGIGGAKLELVVRDSALDPGKAVQAANELVGDNQIRMVVGPSLSAFYNAAKDTYEQNAKINCQPGVGTGDFSVLKYGFRSQDPNYIGVEKLMQYFKSKGVTSVGLVYEADDAGKANDGFIAELAPKYGIEYLGFQQTRPDDQTHRPYVDKLKGAGAIMVSSNVSGAKTMAAAGEAGYQGVLAGTSGLQNVSFLDAAGDRAIDSVFSAVNVQFNIRDRASWKPGYRDHVDTIVKKYGVIEGPKSGAKMPKGTAIAADCVTAFAAAAESVKTLDPDKIASAMTKLDIPDTETPSGNRIKPADHEFYHVEDLHIYRWDKDGQGWFITDVTPGS